MKLDKDDMRLILAGLSMAGQRASTNLPMGSSHMVEWCLSDADALLAGFEVRSEDSSPVLPQLAADQLCEMVKRDFKNCTHEEDCPGCKAIERAVASYEEARRDLW